MGSVRPLYRAGDGGRSPVELGIWTEAEAAEIRAEGERVLADPPWPTGYEEWRPPASWTPLGLPRDWHVV